MHNFAAETVSFFLQDEKLETVMTPPIKFEVQDPEHLGKEYKMRVYLDNANTTMYDRHSAFGPPVDDGTNDMVFYEPDVPVVASAPITVASSPAALAAAKTCSDSSCTPSVTDLEANPSITLVPIDGNGTAVATGKVYFFDPNNYKTTTNTFASASLQFESNPASKINAWNTSHASNTTTGFVGTNQKIRYFELNDVGGGSSFRVHYYDPWDFVRYSKFSKDDNTAQVPASFEMTFQKTTDASPNLDFADSGDKLLDRGIGNESTAWIDATDDKLPGFNLSKAGSLMAKFRYFDSDDTVYQ